MVIGVIIWVFSVVAVNLLMLKSIYKVLIKYVGKGKKQKKKLNLDLWNVLRRLVLLALLFFVDLVLLGMWISLVGIPGTEPLMELLAVFVFILILLSPKIYKGLLNGLVKRNN